MQQKFHYKLSAMNNLIKDVMAAPGWVSLKQAVAIKNSELELPACADESAAVSSVLLELVSRKTTPTNITGELHFTEIVRILGNFYNFVQTALLCV